MKKGIGVIFLVCGPQTEITFGGIQIEFRQSLFSRPSRLFRALLPDLSTSQTFPTFPKRRL